MSHLLSLPVELHFHILSLLHDDPPSYRSLFLTCRALNDAIHAWNPSERVLRTPPLSREDSGTCMTKLCETHNLSPADYRRAFPLHWLKTMLERWMNEISYTRGRCFLSGNNIQFITNGSMQVQAFIS